MNSDRRAGDKIGSGENEDGERKSITEIQIVKQSVVFFECVTAAPQPQMYCFRICPLFSRLLRL